MTTSQSTIMSRNRSPRAFLFVTPALGECPPGERAGGAGENAWGSALVLEGGNPDDGRGLGGPVVEFGAEQQDKLDAGRVLECEALGMSELAERVFGGEG